MSDKKKIALAMVASSLALLSNGLQADETPMAQIQEEELAYTDLGSGEEVRSNLVSQANSSKRASHSKKTADGQCGDGDGSSQQNKGTKKPTEGQCGEGKCGESKSGGTGDAKQPSEGNCGETKSSTSSNQDNANRNMKNRNAH